MRSGIGKNWLNGNKSVCRVSVSVLSILAVLLTATLALPGLPLIGSGPAYAAENNPLTISGDPLRITVMDDSTFGVFRNQGGTYVNQHYGNYAKGSVIWLNGNNTSYRWGGGSSSFVLNPPAFTPVSHTQPDSWTVLTSYDAGSSGVRITETITYTNGSSYYQVKWEIANSGASTYNDLRFFHGADTYFGGDDSASGYWNEGLKMVYLRNPGVSGIMGFYADNSTPSSYYMETDFSSVNSQCMSGNHLTNTVNADFVDAGYALEWDQSALAPGATWTIIAYEKWTETGNVQVYAPSERNGDPGDTVTLPFTVQNFELASDTFNLTPSSANGWTVSAPASITLDSGASGNVDVQVTIPGGATPGSTDQVTLQAVSASNPSISNSDQATVRVNAAPSTHTITASAGEHGAIDPAGAVSVNDGDDKSFTIAADAHYHIADVLVDGVSVGAVSTHTFEDVTANHTIAASFAIDQFNVNASVSGGHGAVSPAVQTINFGGTAAIAITPDPHYLVISITDNGVTKAVANPYVIENVSANHNVVVTFTIETCAWYLAEGSTAGGMETYITVQNPQADPVYISMKFQTEAGQVQGSAETIPGYTRRTYSAASYVNSYNVSTTVNAAGGDVVCERAMYGDHRTWAHNSIGTKTPSPTWYLVEGSTQGGMETYILVQNPGSTDVSVGITFQTDKGELRPQELQGVTIPAASRRTFKVNDFVTTFDVSTKVTATGGNIICERAMYGGNGSWAINSIGTTQTSSSWFLAEGYVDGGIETFVLVQNPGTSDVRIAMTLETSSGQVIPEELQWVTIPAGSRRTFRINDYLTALDVSIAVTSMGGNVICERSMYGRDRTWATGSIGYCQP